MRRLVTVVAVVAVALLGVSAAQAKGPGGNSANAKLCQKGGWQTLVGADGTAFASEQECVSFGAQGGTVVAKSGAQLRCEELGGTFTPNPSSDYYSRQTIWACQLPFKAEDYPSYPAQEPWSASFREFCLPPEGYSRSELVWQGPGGDDGLVWPLTCQYA